MRYRIPILPASVNDGIITFNTITFDVEFTDVNTKLLSIMSGDPVNIYIDPSKEPKFSRCSDGRGWCSPTEEKQEQLVAAGIDIDECTIIRCKCQQGSMTREDVMSLEQCGHAKECPKAVSRSIEPIHRSPTISIISESQSVTPGIDPEVLASVQKEAAKPKKDFCPPNGIPQSFVTGPLVAHMEGASASEMSVSTALEALGYDKPYEESVVIRELVKFANFTACSGCNNWSTVMNLSNPKCPGCGAMPNSVMDE